MEEDSELLSFLINFALLTFELSVIYVIFFIAMVLVL